MYEQTQPATDAAATEQHAPEAAAQPEATQPAAQDPAVTKFETDAKAAGQNLLADAKAGLKDQIESAKVLVSKLLTAAAGDVAPLVTDAEAAAIPLAAHAAGPWGADVRTFGALVVGAAGSTIDADASKAVSIGLAHALAGLNGAAADVERYLS